MADIFHTFIINAPANKVFEGITTSEGLDNWWTKSSQENRIPGGIYNLYFGEQYNWRAIVTKYVLNKVFELQIIDAMPDWLDTKVGFVLTEKDNITEINFYHTGWPQRNEHYKISSYCWAMYLRILKRYIEFGEQVIYEDRLNV